MKNKNSVFAFTQKENGNAVVMVLVALVVVAVGALAYLSGQMAGEQNQTPTENVASSAQASEGTDTAQVDDQPLTIQPGDPVVAKVGDIEIKRQAVFEFLQTLPPESRQQPLEQLFPAALEQIINAKIVEDKVKDVKLDNDAEVKKLLSEAKSRIVQTVYVQNKVNEKVTDARVKEAYDAYIKNFPEVQEVKAAHILVDDEAKAKDLIKQLNDGADFAELAKENSKDSTAPNGGDLGYFLQDSVVPEFGKAAFSTEPGTYTKEPVKSQFGFHIIKVEDKRNRPPADLETARPFLETQLRQALLQEVISEWRNEYEIERFNINGEPLNAAPVSPPVENNAG